MAYAQDATVLAVLGAPPLFLAPLLAALIRSAWLRRATGPRLPNRRLAALGVLELVLWMIAGWLAALLVFQEEWLSAIPLGAILVVIVALNRRLLRQASWLWSVAIASVFPAVWLLLQLLSYSLLLGYGRLSA